MLPGTAEPVMSEVDESMVASPPLELRRPASGPRITSVPLSLQSPGDRATGKFFHHIFHCAFFLTLFLCSFHT